MKKIYDPVHGFIHLDDLEGELIDSLPFQRLRYIRQLGIAYLVYPGAQHTRFEHSLGTMELATRIFDQVTKYHTLEDKDYFRRVVRFAALCHDLGHLPFSHVAEKALLGKDGHEGWTKKIIESDALAPIWNKLQNEYPAKKPIADIIKIALGDKNQIVGQLIAGDFFGADRIDYLLRDAKCTGVAFGLFDYQQLIEMLRPVEVNGEWQLAIEENGIASCEALLLARHFMHQRVYRYSSVKAYNFHLCRFMKECFKESRTFEEMGSYLYMTDNEVISKLNENAKIPGSLGHTDANVILMRAPRFKVIEADLDKDELENMKKELCLPDLLFQAEFSKSKKVHFDFPVKKGSEIIPANEYRKIIFPPPPTLYLYVSPEHEETVKAYLKVKFSYHRK